MEKKVYKAPHCEIYHFNIRETFLAASVTKVEGVGESVDEDAGAKKNFLWEDDDDFESWDIN